MAVLLTIVVTFFGAAACYRLRTHMNVTVVTALLPAAGQRACELLVEALMAAISLFMVVYGIGLVQATWYNSIADFPFLSVGVTYLPIPIGGAITLVFIIEHLLLGEPPIPCFDDPDAPAAFREAMDIAILLG